MNGNTSSISLSSESSTWRERFKKFKQHRDAKTAPVLHFQTSTPPPASLQLPAQKTPSPTRVDEASIIDSYQKAEQEDLYLSNHHRSFSPSSLSVREPISSKECLQRAKFLKERAHDYLQESRILLDRASVMAFEEASRSHDKALRREDWARRAKKHADRLENIIIK
ncbi:hypothetical protein E3Q17_03715 [Wallemia mellicola]|uniref:Uncharacterized protein n=1 Tax=Wallemia mellicola TaxID=1708541 RepID=A0A4T0LG46_9BASI|nr:hypothetical protein E3Q24_03632 [Wallemia mellicola]TIB96718.1 hypothetical protein E3Q17_03715 [Wallemia mellicola]TIC21184.1 hypothetical protein E3Q12_03664 [Wallemia mellicola]TIC32601.1 hypothetical protein E3Q09_03708 [Wallemia mellicola]TIC59954.1 hypothetical protein E3Q03_03574 [Wallemia mellicola]